MNKKIVNVQKIKCEESNSDVLVIIYEDGSIRVLCHNKEACGLECPYRFIPGKDNPF